MAPPTAVAPGDSTTSPFNNKYGFKFGQLGVRVPTIVVSPYVAIGIIDKRVYDHSSIPATIEERFGLARLTERDKQAARLTGLLTLTEPRTDAQTTLPSPVSSGAMFEFLDRLETDFERIVLELGIEDEKSVDPALAGFVHIAVLRKISASSPADKDSMINEAKGVQSNADAVRYIHKVRTEIRAM
jgi:phospholipase C